MDYTAYVSTMARLMVFNIDDAEFQAILPQMIRSAEIRICRDLDWISMTVTDDTTGLVTGQRAYAIPPEFVVVENINVIDNTNGIWPLTPAARSVLDTIYGDATVTGVPTRFAMVTQTSIIIGPAPNAPYTLEVIGNATAADTVREQPGDVIATEFEDLFTYASMIYGAGFMKNFGAMADDPQMAMSWNTQYKNALESANIEEMRKRFHSQAWSSQTPVPTTPAQG